jgi:DNA polymerase III epsilon subunit-like protein
MADFIFDTETTGLPVRGASYKDIDKYDSARIVSISWIVSRNHQPVTQAYYIIKPDGYRISEASIKIHGITNEEAHRDGVPLRTVIELLMEVIPQCHNIVAHNAEFDMNILRSELFRYMKTIGGASELLDKLNTMNVICTMHKGKEVMNMKRFPKLSALYSYLYNEEMQNAHNAQADTYYCYKCYKSMFPVDRSVFFFGNRMVKLTEAQAAIVYEEFNKNLLVIACAGSGKTVSLICRIKYMLDSGVDESSIMLTTFTRDAAYDMKNKLFDIMGHKTKIKVGTIDSISKYFSDRFDHGSAKSLKDVGEYNYLFLNAIKANPEIISKYKYLFVDEFQDINDIQYEIIKEFYKNGCNIFCVGDDAQNIYTFRGSKVEYILNFEKLFGNAKTMYLMQNFRSCKEIIDLANASIEKNVNSIPKTMIPGREPTASDIETRKPLVSFFQSRHHQNQKVVDNIQKLISDGVEEHNIVVLCPINQPLYMIEELLTKKKIKNVYLDGKCDVKTTKKQWHVCLCTIHKSKGLEWDYVFMINMSDEVLPKTKTPASIEEARRLFYVGVTRARKELYVYYNVMIDQEPYVTRYISELDKSLYKHENMTEECFMGVSKFDFTPDEISVTKLIENLDGKDYINLKELGVIPQIDIKATKKRKIYESFSYMKFIENDELYSDFGIFIEKVIKRALAVFTGNAKLCKDNATLMCLANVKLEPRLYTVYCVYKTNFRQNLKNIKHLLPETFINRDTIISLLERNTKPIHELHVFSVIEIIRLLYEKSTQFKIAIEDVPVFSERFLPEGFERIMKCANAEYNNIENETIKSRKDIINNIWEISKCTKIVKEYRRRLLYKNIDIDDLMQYGPLYENINKELMEFLMGFMKDVQNISLDEKVEIKDTLLGELDLRIGDVVIDYKTSINDDISMQWILQLLCYKVLCDANDKPINTIAILNPLRGWYIEFDVSTWCKHDELVAYLVEAKNKKLVT